MALILLGKVQIIFMDVHCRIKIKNIAHLSFSERRLEAKIYVNIFPRAIGIGRFLTENLLFLFKKVSIQSTSFPYCVLWSI